MEWGSAPRCGPRALPATSPSGPSPRCDWGLESSTRGKPAFLTIPLMVAQRARESAERSSSPFSLSLSLFWALSAARCPSQPLQFLLSLASWTVLTLLAGCNVRLPLPPQGTDRLPRPHF